MSDRFFHRNDPLDQVNFLGLLDNYPCPVLVIDLETLRILYGNPEACRFYVYLPEQLQSMTIDDLRLSTENDVSHDNPYKTMLAGIFYDTHRTGIGEQFYMEVRAVSLPVLDRQVGVLFLHDITYDRKIKDKLRNSEHYYRTLCDQSPIPLFVYDWSAIKRYLDALHLPDPRLLKEILAADPQKLMDCLVQIDLKYINRQVFALFEIPDRETLYKNFLSLITPETYQSFLDILAALFNGNQQVNGRTRINKPSGEAMDIFYRITLPDEYKTTWSKIIIGVMDVTGFNLPKNYPVTRI